MPTIQTIPLNKLYLAKENVRKAAPRGIEGLAESIHAKGPYSESCRQGGEDDTFGVVAGGTRLAALKLLVKAGRLAADAPIMCNVVEAEDAHEISLAENEQREGMHPADQFDAFKKLADEGMGEDTIAARFGVAPTVVKQRLKLAVVNPKLVKTYRAGDMTLEQLMAFTLTDDHKRQEKIWKELPDWARKNGGPERIRDTLVEKHIDATENKLAKFITVEAYEKAGGVVVRNLFEAESAGNLTDPALLQKLTDEMLQYMAENVKADGWKWVSIMPDLNWQAEKRSGHIQPTLSAEAQKRLEEIEARLEEFVDGEEDEQDAL